MEPIRVLIVTDREAHAASINRILVENGLVCVPSSPVSLELAADRASRIPTDILILDLPHDSDRGFDTLREVTNTASIHVLVIGPADNPKRILKALHLGADEYLDVNSLEDELTEAIIRFKSRKSNNDSFDHSPGRIISLLSPSGGSGSSTLAVNVASVLAREHGTCGLIDLRLASGDLGPLLNLRPTYSVADVCDNLTRLDRSMFDVCFMPHECGVQLLAAPPSPGAEAIVSTKGIRQVLAMARRRFSYVVTDIESSVGELEIEVLWQSEVIVLVLRLDYISLRNARRVLDLIQDSGLELDRVLLVANRYGQRKQLSLRQAEAALKMKIHHLVPEDTRLINLATNSGQPVVLSKPGAKVSRSLIDLAAGVNGGHVAGRGLRK